MTMKGARRHLLVVGASAGIGRALAEVALEQGAQVVLAARRQTLLAEVAGGSERGTVVEVDVTDPSQCAAMARSARQAVGPLDVVVVSAGLARMVRMIESEHQHWHEVLSTNVIGVNQVIRSVLPHMAPGGIVAALSSDTVGSPRATLGPYGASKAAVEQSLLSWREEHPEVRFTTVTVGGTMPTGFGDSFDPDLTMEALAEWIRSGRMQRRQMETTELARLLWGMLHVALENPGVAVEHLRLRAPSGPARSLDELEL